jgi:hypothetical protein
MMTKCQPQHRAHDVTTSAVAAITAAGTGCYNYQPKLAFRSVNAACLNTHSDSRLRPGRDRHHRYRYCRQLLLTRTHHSARPHHAAGATWALPLPRAHHFARASLVLHAIAVAVVTVITPGVNAEEEAGEEDHRDDEYNPRNNSDPRRNLADPARTVVAARRRHSRWRLDGTAFRGDGGRLGSIFRCFTHVSIIRSHPV